MSTNHYYWSEQGEPDWGIIWLRGEPVAHFPYCDVPVGTPEHRLWEKRINKLVTSSWYGRRLAMQVTPEVDQLVDDLIERFGPCPTLSK